MTPPVVFAASFGLPDPFGLVSGLVDGLLDASGAALGNLVEDAVRWMVDAVLGALVDLATALLGFFWDAAEPDVSAGWFAGGPSTPYGEMVVLAAPLLVAFFLAGVIQGVVRGDAAAMVQMAVVRLPGAVLAMAVVIAIVDLLLRVTDEMSDVMLAGFRDDIEETTRLLGQVAATPGLTGAGQLLLLVFGGVGLLAAVVLVIELFVRAGLIYIVVALSPLIYAAAVWEQMRGAVRRLAELGFALIVSKFVIAVALSLSAAALVAAWPGGEATEIALPEQAAGDGIGTGAGVAQTIGLLIGAVVMFGVAAFMPFVLFRLLPIAEGALVAQGIKAGPMRAVQQAHHTALIARHNPATTSARRGLSSSGSASGGTGSGAGGAGGATSAAAAGGASSGGAATGAAAAGPAAPVVAAAAAGVQATKATGRRAAAAAERSASAQPGGAQGSAETSPASTGGGARAASSTHGPSGTPTRGSAATASGSAGSAGSRAADVPSDEAPRREVRQVRWGATSGGGSSGRSGESGSASISPRRTDPPSGPARRSGGPAR